jgi:hypothetical protein
MITSRAFDKNIVVATHGGGIYSTKVVNVGIQDALKMSDINIGFPFPNPGKGKTSLEFSINQAKRLNISVYNLLGVRIQEVENENFSIGKHEVKWDTGTYTNGIYLVVLSDGKQTVQRKLLVKD